MSAVLAQQACPCTGDRQCKAAESHCQRSKQAGAGLRQGVSVLHSGIRAVGGQNRGVRRIGPCILYRMQLRVFRGDGGIRAGLRFRLRVGVRVGSVGTIRVRSRRGQLRMSGFQGQTLAASGDGIGAVAVILKSNILAVQKLLGNARVTMEIPALALGVNVPAIDAVAAVLQDIADACIACGEGQLAATQAVRARDIAASLNFLLVMITLSFQIFTCYKRNINRTAPNDRSQRLCL